MLLLVLNLAGTFAFGLSGGMAGVRERLDLFGVVVLAVVVGLAGGITRDLLIGVPPATIRDWRYLAVAGGAGLVTLLAHPLLSRIGGPIDVLDAAGLALFCVTGASTALDHGLAAAPAVILGAITGIGGGVLRDILVRQVPVVLREGLYAIPALIGAAIVVGAARAGAPVAIANALGISVSELAGAPSHRVDLTGDWWTCWQTSRGGVEDIRTQPVQLDQHGELIQIEATARGRPVEEGGYLWRGELRLWDNEILLGWYAASDGSVRSKGTMYFVMHPHGISATGRWVGLSYDGNIVTGWSSMARTEADARELVGELKEQDAPSSR